MDKEKYQIDSAKKILMLSSDLEYGDTPDIERKMEVKGGTKLGEIVKDILFSLSKNAITINLETNKMETETREVYDKFNVEDFLPGVGYAKVVNNIIAIFVISVFLSSCYNLKKAEKQVVKAHVKYPEVTAKYCSSFYPTKDSTITKVEYRKGDTITSVDTFYTECDSVGQIIPCKQKTKTIIDTLYSEKEVIRENTARTQTLINELKKANEENAVLEYKVENLNKWKWLAIAAMAVLAFFGANKLFKFLPF